jgi:L-cysteate sulfo-lyase
VGHTGGGTQAGLLAGLRLAGLDRVRVLGVSADDPADQIVRTIGGILTEVELLLHAPVCSLQSDVVVDDGYTGPGYGVPSAEGEEALRLLARLEGIVLDPVYTAKAFAGMLGWLREKRFDSANEVLFWHTGGQMALFSPSGR